MPQALVFNFAKLHMHNSKGITPPPPNRVGLQRLEKKPGALGSDASSATDLVCNLIQVTLPSVSPSVKEEDGQRASGSNIL